MRGWPRRGILVRLVRPDSPKIRTAQEPRTDGVAARKAARRADLCGFFARSPRGTIVAQRLLRSSSMETCPHHSDAKKCEARARDLLTKIDDRASATEALETVI